MVRWIMNGVPLEWWLELSENNTVATLWVQKQRSTTEITANEKYPVFSVNSVGECWRHPGLPVGWGFRLTKDRKIKEVR